MFVNVVQFPPVKPGKDMAFREWFRESNSAYQGFKGFISRRLLKAAEPGHGYAAIVEHESKETFMAMHTSPERQELWAKVEPLLEGIPSPSFYEVIEAGSPAENWHQASNGIPGRDATPRSSQPGHGSPP